MNELQIIKGVECYLDESGVAQLNLEHVARGLGFTQEKNGTLYVRWDRVQGYLAEFGFSPQVGKGDFIPEPIFYLLSMKAENDTAKAFQHLVAYEILPAIRKHGAYLTPEKIEEVLLNPDTIIRLATDLKEERSRRIELENVNAQQRQLLAEFSPKASYYDVVLQTQDVLSATQVAKDYGKSAQWLNDYLHEKGIQYKQGGVWLLYQKYAEQGYTKSRTNTFSGSDGMQHSNIHTYWTQKGRLFIYDLLKADGILPIMERQDKAG
ncbi:phage antirepressor KilAC domain-containing protein [Anaerotruncus rubiinfantis]|uniref:phage antirepressor KilAC domain-containing protein n=1 Tax=Anaerotruncus rubiinfantis TaxID=1720200 RepID=UPI0011C7EC16|nr:phage antirepressor KilAC domain-containing protein [Anaerotruncus rubiinfantis]